jgi:hypothetical protein
MLAGPQVGLSPLRIRNLAIIYICDSCDEAMYVCVIEGGQMQTDLRRAGPSSTFEQFAVFYTLHQTFFVMCEPSL